MNFQIRKQKILELVDKQGSAEVKELAEQLNTSEITIRRDLTTLAEQGLLVRTHGGVIKPSLVRDPVSFVNKTAVNQERKEYICQLAARYIQEGDTVFIDCGSTTYQLCRFIRHLRIRVVTNSLPVALALLDSEVHLNLAGGEVDAERQALHGSMVVEHLQRYRADKAFIGVDGISVARGLTANSETEASISTAMAANAQRTFLLCDSAKLEKDKYFQFAPLSIIDTLITDEEALPDVLDRYRNAGLEVVNGAVR